MAIMRRSLLATVFAGLVAGGSRLFGGTPDRIGRLTLTDAQWRKRLSSSAYDVLRHAGTERPYTSMLLHEYRKGRFACAGCDLAVFDSSAKFDSGTGWPSFWQALPGAVEQRSDFDIGIPRVEVRCARCQGHLGHVFNDGPPPTGKRYCMNGVALSFHPVPK